MSTENTSSAPESSPNTGNTPPASAPSTQPSNGYDPKIVGIVAYLTLIGWIVALIMNNPKSSYGSFHLRQSLGIMLLFLVSGFIMIIPILGWIIGLVGYLFAFVLWIIGLIGAVQGTQKPAPLLGEKSQEWFQAL